MRYDNQKTSRGPQRGRAKGRTRHGRKGGSRLFDYGELRLLVLAMTAEKPRHGYELIKEISKRFDGRYSPSPGVIYPTLAWLEDVGYINIAEDDSGRKQCQLTSEGHSFLEANRAAATELLQREPPPGRPDFIPTPIGQAMDELKASLRQRLTTGAASPDEIRAISEAILEAARWVRGTAPVPRPMSASVTSSAGSSGPGSAIRESEEAPSTSVITRHRHDTKRRSLSVQEVYHLTPLMVRVVLYGEDLDDFISLGFDDHIKLFFDESGDRPVMREYTPRAFDREAKTLTLDFAIHEAGPATAWALEAKPGSVLRMGGPRGSTVIAPVFDWYLLIGDETALPAIGRGAEEFSAGVKVLTLAAIPGPADEQSFFTAAELQSSWVYRSAADGANPEPLLAALKTLDLPAGRGFIWIAAESGVARALKLHVLKELKHPPEHLKASGYWTSGVAAGGKKSLD